MKTFIKWPGNKSRYLKHIISEIPSFTGTYYEPFLGSGAVFLKLQPKEWVINDINKELHAVWKLVQKNPEIIIKKFKKFAERFIKLSVEDKKKLCHDIIITFNEGITDEETVLDYLLMNHCVYMGHLIRKGKYNFYGLELHVLNDKYFFLRDTYYNKIREISEYIKNGKIFNKDYKKIICKAKEGDFVFLDPPYVESHNYQFEYNKNENLFDMKVLLKELKKLDKRGVKWLMTQSDTDEIRDIFKDYIVKPFEVYRSMSPKNSFKKELIIKNYS
jgi:DNA adenine methylase